MREPLKENIVGFQVLQIFLSRRSETNSLLSLLRDPIHRLVFRQQVLFDRCIRLLRMHTRSPPIPFLTNLFSLVAPLWKKKRKHINRETNIPAASRLFSWLDTFFSRFNLAINKE